MIDVDSSAQNQAKTFRLILEAMSHPGRIVDFKVPSLSPTSGLSAEMATLLFTLCDFQTSIWMKSKAVGIEKFLKFHAGATFTNTKSAATYAIVNDPEKLSSLEEFAQGTHEYPDRSTTLVIQADTMSNGGRISLAGPGIANQTRFNVEKLGVLFWADVAANHAQYPLGVDLIFVSKGKIAAIPRSTQIQVQEQD